MPGSMIDHAERPEGVPVGVDEWDARVGDDTDVADGRVVAQDFVLAGIVNDQWLAATRPRAGRTNG